MRHYRGLPLISTTGVVWRWVGWKREHVGGRDTRIEKWQAVCPECGESIMACARLSSGLRTKFYGRRYQVAPSQVVEVRFPIPLRPTPPAAFQLRGCNDHPHSMPATVRDSVLAS